MPRRIHLDQAYLEKVKKKQQETVDRLDGLSPKQIPCVYCGGRTIDKYDDLTGHFTAFCPKCGQIGVYNAADYRRYPVYHTRKRKVTCYTASLT